MKAKARQSSLPAYGSNAPRVDVKELYFGNTDSKPVNYDWTQGYGETWDFAESERGEDGETILVNVAGDDGSFEGPMMSYYYPLEDTLRDMTEAAKCLVDLPLCVVHFNESDTYGLALTGGGMDLSWEICEAFMRLGYLPPVHFCRLPAMAGRGVSPRDKWIISGCRRALQGLKVRVGSDLRHLRETFKG